MTFKVIKTLSLSPHSDVRFLSVLYVLFRVSLIIPPNNNQTTNNSNHN